MLLKIKHIFKKYPLASYFGLAYLISWAIWAPMVLLYLQHKPDQFSWRYLFPAGVGVYGPTFAALIVTSVAEGKAGLKALLQKYLLWRTRPGWYVFTLLFFPLVYTLGTLLYIIFSGDQTDFHPAVLVGIPIIFLLSVPFGPLGEELGWRGFALPRLKKAHSWVKANLILGFLWYAWHLPAMFVPGVALPAVQVTAQVVLQYALMLLGFTFLFSLVYDRTGGSVFLTILLHASINSTAQVVNPLFWGRISAEQTMPVLWTITGVLWLVLLGMRLSTRSLQVSAWSFPPDRDARERL